jgi:hypothetical protein
MLSQQMLWNLPEPWEIPITEKLNQGGILGDWDGRVGHIIGLTFKMFISLGKNGKILSL